MLSSEYNNLTGNDQLNYVKSRLNKVIYENAKKSYAMKQELNGIEDVSQLKTENPGNPFLLKKGEDINNNISTIENLYDKLSTQFENFRGYFAYGTIGRQQGQRFFSINDMSKLKQTYNHMIGFVSNINKEIDKIQEYPEMISKDNNKLIDKIIKDLEQFKSEIGDLHKVNNAQTSPNPLYAKYVADLNEFTYFKKLTQKGKNTYLKKKPKPINPGPNAPPQDIPNPDFGKVSSALIYPGQGMSDNDKAVVTDIFNDIIPKIIGNEFKHVEGLLQRFQLLSKSSYNKGLNPLSQSNDPFMDPDFQKTRGRTPGTLSGYGMIGGNNWYPTLYPDIPQKFM